MPIFRSFTDAAASAWAAHRGEPLLSLPWFDNFAREIGVGPDQLRLAVAADADVVLPLQRAAMPVGHWSAHGLRSLSNYYTAVYQPWVAPQVQSEQAFIRLSGLLRELRHAEAVDFIQLQPMPYQTPEQQVVLAALDDAGFGVHEFFCFGNWYEPVAGRSFDDYFAQRPSQVRNTWQRKKKALDRDHAWDIRLYQTPDEVDQGVDAFESVYNESWKQREPYPGFIRGWARTCAKQGWLRLAVLTLNGEAVAAQFWYTAGGRAQIFKLAYRESFKTLSVGLMLTVFLFRHAMDVDRVDEIDYLCGDDGYKQDWMTQRRERWGVLACNIRRPMGLVLHAMQSAGELRRRWAARGSAKVDSAHDSSRKSTGDRHPIA